MKCFYLCGVSLTLCLLRLTSALPARDQEFNSVLPHRHRRSISHEQEHLKRKMCENHPSKYICCGGRVFRRGTGDVKCCHKEFYNPKDGYCDDGTVHEYRHGVCGPGMEWTQGRNESAGTCTPCPDGFFKTGTSKRGCIRCHKCTKFGRALVFRRCSKKWNTICDYPWVFEKLRLCAQKQRCSARYELGTGDSGNKMLDKSSKKISTWETRCIRRGGKRKKGSKMATFEKVCNTWRGRKSHSSSALPIPPSGIPMTSRASHSLKLESFNGTMVNTSRRIKSTTSANDLIVMGAEAEFSRASAGETTHAFTLEGSTAMTSDVTVSTSHSVRNGVPLLVGLGLGLSVSVCCILSIVIVIVHSQRRNRKRHQTATTTTCSSRASFKSLPTSKSDFQSNDSAFAKVSISDSSPKPPMRKARRIALSLCTCAKKTSEEDRERDSSDWRTSTARTSTIGSHSTDSGYNSIVASSKMLIRPWDPEIAVFLQSKHPPRPESWKLPPQRRVDTDQARCEDFSQKRHALDCNPEDGKSMDSSNGEGLTTERSASESSSSVSSQYSVYEAADDYGVRYVPWSTFVGQRREGTTTVAEGACDGVTETTSPRSGQSVEAIEDGHLQGDVSGAQTAAEAASEAGESKSKEEQKRAPLAMPLPADPPSVSTTSGPHASIINGKEEEEVCREIISERCTRPFQHVATELRLEAASADPPRYPRLSEAASLEVISEQAPRIHQFKNEAPRKIPLEQTTSSLAPAKPKENTGSTSSERSCFKKKRFFSLPLEIDQARGQQRPFSFPLPSSAWGSKVSVEERRRHSHEISTTIHLRLPPSPEEFTEDDDDDEDDYEEDCQETEDEMDTGLSSESTEEVYDDASVLPGPPRFFETRLALVNRDDSSDDGDDEHDHDETGPENPVPSHAHALRNDVGSNNVLLKKVENNLREDTRAHLTAIKSPSNLLRSDEEETTNSDSLPLIQNGRLTDSPQEESAASEESSKDHLLLKEDEQRPLIHSMDASSSRHKKHSRRNANVSFRYSHHVSQEMEAALHPTERDPGGVVPSARTRPKKEANEANAAADSSSPDQYLESSFHTRQRRVDSEPTVARTLLLLSSVAKPCSLDKANLASSYSAETATQTSNSSQPTRDLLGGEWQFHGVFSPEGGVLEKEHSDVRLAIEKDTVPVGTEVWASVHTDVSRLRQKLFRQYRDYALLSPVAEFASSVPAFRRRVMINIPYVEPAGFKETCFKVMGFRVENNGEITIGEVPLLPGHADDSQDSASLPACFFAFSGPGVVTVHTLHFSGYYCVHCRKNISSVLYALAFGRHVLRPRPSARVRMYVADNKFLLKDFFEQFKKEESAKGRQYLDKREIRLLDNVHSRTFLIFELNPEGSGADQWSLSLRQNGQPRTPKFQKVLLEDMIRCCQERDPQYVEWILDGRARSEEGEATLAELECSVDVWNHYSDPNTLEPSADNFRPDYGDHRGHTVLNLATQKAEKDDVADLIRSLSSKMQGPENQERLAQVLSTLSTFQPGGPLATPPRAFADKPRGLSQPHPAVPGAALGLAPPAQHPGVARAMPELPESATAEMPADFPAMPLQGGGQERREMVHHPVQETSEDTDATPVKGVE